MADGLDEVDRQTVGGLVAGGVGGVALCALAAVRSLEAHRDVWFQMKLAALPFFGARGFEPGFALGPVVVGLLLHFAIALSWGLLFAICFQGLSKPGSLIAGAGWGLVTWLVMFYGVMPLFGLGYLARMAPVRPVIFEHIVFGFFVALGFLPFQREVTLEQAWRRIQSSRDP